MIFILKTRLEQIRASDAKWNREDWCHIWYKCTLTSTWLLFLGVRVGFSQSTDVQPTPISRMGKQPQEDPSVNVIKSILRYETVVSLPTIHVFCFHRIISGTISFDFNQYVCILSMIRMTCVIKFYLSFQWAPAQYILHT